MGSERSARLDLSTDAADHGDVSLHVLLGAMLIGAGIGFVSGAFGKGGSAIATPLLHVIGVPAMVALASPLPATIPSTLLAGRATPREGHVDRRVVRLGSPSGLPAVVVGACCTRWMRGGPLVLATDALVLAARSARRCSAPTTRRRRATTHSAPCRPRAIVGRTGVVGFVSGLLGNAAASCSPRCSCACSACRCTARSARRSCSRPCSRSRARSCTRGSATSTGR